MRVSQANDSLDKSKNVISTKAALFQKEKKQNKGNTQLAQAKATSRQMIRVNRNRRNSKMQKFMSAIRSKSPMNAAATQRQLLVDLKKLSKTKSRMKSPMNQNMKFTFQDESELPNIQKKLAKNILKK